MLDKMIAKRLAQKISDQLGYNINIMNEKGIIIASGDDNRVGDFHETAWRIIRDRLDTQTVTAETNLIGVKPGVNMPIILNGDYIGVVGITGEPDTVHHFASLVKMSVETMLEFELYKEIGRQRQNTRTMLANVLLHEEPYTEERVQRLVKELEFTPGLTRLPLIIRAPGVDSPNMVKTIVSSSHHHPQDMVFTVWNDIVVFKMIPDNQIRNYRSLVTAYINNLNHQGIELICFGGTLQQEFSQYRVGWRHALWLKKHLGKDAGSINHFLDNLLTYIQDMVPADTFHDIFNVLAKTLDATEQAAFIETVEGLYQNNMNMNLAAQQLHMHRNTMLFRINKLRKTLGIDPIKSIADRYLIFALLYYLKSTEHK